MPVGGFSDSSLEMRATWLSSILTGVGSGVVAGMMLPEANYTLAVNGRSVFERAPVFIILLASYLLGAVGMGQLREVHSERRRRGGIGDPNEWDLSYFATCGRMAVWLCGTAAGYYLARWFAWNI